MQSGKNFGTKCNRKIQQKIAFLASAAATILETKDPEFIPNMVATTAYMQSHETPIQQTMWFYPTVVGVQSSWRSFTHLPISAFGSKQRPHWPFFFGRICPIVSKVDKICRKFPKGITRCKSYTQLPKKCQNMPWIARRYQVMPKVAKISQKLPKDAKTVATFFRDLLT